VIQVAKKKNKPEEKKDIKNPNEVYSEVEIVKDSTKPISFRVDSEVYRKIATLEKVKKEQKSTIIKEAIDNTFTKMMFQHLNSELYKINKEIFPKIKFVAHYMMGSDDTRMLGEQNDGDDDDDKNPFSDTEGDVFRCSVLYRLDFPNYEDEKSGHTYSLNQLSIEITNEASNIIKLKVRLNDLSNGDINKINQELFTKISLLVSKDGFQVETNTDKKNISQTLFFERGVDFDYSKWLKRYKHDITQLKKTTEKINQLFKNVKELKENNKKRSNVGMLRLLD